MICTHVKLSSKTENGVETACSRYRTESVIVIADSVRKVFHVLTLHNESKFIFFEITPVLLNLVFKSAQTLSWGVKDVRKTF